MTRIKAGERLKNLSTGGLGTAALDQQDAAIQVNQDDGVATVWVSGDVVRLDPLKDLIETVLNDVKAGKYKPSITPAEYGFKTEDEYWKAMKKLAGLN